MFGHHGHASETPFKWRSAGGQKMARFWWYLDPLSPKKRCQSWTPSDKTFWIRACLGIALNRRSIGHNLKSFKLYILLSLAKN